MKKFDIEAIRGRAWWTSSDLVALTVAAGDTCLFYVRNLSLLRKVYVGRLLLTGTQSAAWGFWVGPAGPATEAALANFMAARNADLSYQGTRGVDGDCDVVLKAGVDGQDRIGGLGSSAVLTRSYETRQIDMDGSISLGLADTFAIVCDPQAGGDFACTVGFWQKQDPRWMGA